MRDSSRTPSWHHGRVAGRVRLTFGCLPAVDGGEDEQPGDPDPYMAGYRARLRAAGMDLDRCDAEALRVALETFGVSL